MKKRINLHKRSIVGLFERVLSGRNIVVLLSVIFPWRLAVGWRRGGGRTLPGEIPISGGGAPVARRRRRSGEGTSGETNPDSLIASGWAD
jgi:hypothetical protein